MSEHTEGPWMVFINRDNGATRYSVESHTNTAVCVAHDGSFWPENYEPNVDMDGYFQPDHEMDCDVSKISNAYLIAAAPDLLDVISYALDVSSEGLPLGKNWQAKARAAIAKAKGEQE